MLIAWNRPHLIFVPGKETVVVSQNVPLLTRSEGVFRFSCPFCKVTFSCLIELRHWFSKHEALSDSVIVDPNLLLFCVYSEM